MGEYGREQSNQMNRAVANNGFTNNQMKVNKDNRNTSFAQDQMKDCILRKASSDVLQGKWKWYYDMQASDGLSIFKCKSPASLPPYVEGSVHVSKSSLDDGDHVTFEALDTCNHYWRKGHEYDNGNLPPNCKPYAETALNDFDEELEELRLNPDLNSTPFWLVKLLKECTTAQWLKVWQTGWVNYDIYTRTNLPNLLQDKENAQKAKVRIEDGQKPLSAGAAKSIFTKKPLSDTDYQQKIAEQDAILNKVKDGFDLAKSFQVSNSLPQDGEPQRDLYKQFPLLRVTQPLF